MKTKNVLLLCCIMFTTVKLSAQTYHPLPTQNAYWTVYEFDEFNGVYDDKVYTVEGDTLINGLQYTNVYKLNDYPTIYDTVRILHCFMRQDNQAKKIWFIRQYLGETSEKLGYDLSVAIGDTVSLPAFDYGNVGDSIFIRQETSGFDSSMLINGEQRARYFFTLPDFNGYQIVYVEGISDVESTFPNRQYPFDAFHQSLTNCMYENGNYLWPANIWPIDSTYCGFNLVNIKVPDINSFKLYPNPAKDFIILELPINYTTGCFVITDILGNQLNEIDITNNSRQIYVSLSSYPSGIYLLTFKTSITLYYNILIINH